MTHLLRTLGRPDYIKMYVHWFLLPTIAVVLILWPAISSNLEILLSNPGDTLLNLYFLEHGVQHFTSIEVFNPEAFWSPDFFWPVKDTIAWSDHLLGPSAIYGCWRVIFSPYQAYIGWLATTLFLNYISLRWALVRISPQSSALWLSIATLVCSYSPAIIQQIGHPQLLSLFIFGPILYGCNKLLTSKPESITIADLIGLSSWLIVNGFFNIYTFVYSCFCVLVSISIHLARRIYTKNHVIHLGSGLRVRSLLFLILASLNLIIYTPYLRTLETFGRRDIGVIISNLPKPASWLYSSNFNLIPSPAIPAEWIHGVEQELFPGWGFLVLIVAAIITTIRAKNNAEKTISLLWIFSIGILLILSLSINSISLWPIVSKFLPGANSLRASSRVSMQIILFSSGLIANASKNWKTPKFSIKGTIFSSLIITGGFISIWPVNFPRFSLFNWQKQLEFIINALSRKNCSSFWVEPMLTRPWTQHVQAMHAQLLTGIPTLNGYSGHFPAGSWPYSNNVHSKTILSLQSKYRLQEARKNLGLAKGEKPFLNLLAAANQDSNPDVFSKGEIDYAVELVRRSKLKNSSSFSNAKIDEVRSAARTLSNRGVKGVFKPNEAALRASNFAIRHQIEGFKIGNFQYSDFYLNANGERQDYAPPYISDKSKLSNDIRQKSVAKQAANANKAKYQNSYAREYLDYYKEIYAQQTNRYLFEIIDMSTFNLGNHAYGWSVLAPLIENHRLKDYRPREDICLIHVDDDSAKITYIKAKAAIFHGLIYSNNKLIIVTSPENKMAFSLLGKEGWIKAKYLRKHGKKISSDQGPWAIKNASANNEYLLVNLVRLGGTGFQQWKFDINNGELKDTRALSSIEIKPLELSHTSNKPYRVLRGKGIELAKDQHGRLVFQKSTNQASENWQAILREGQPVKYNNSPYRFAAVRLRDGVIEILDINEQQHIGYRWKVDAVTGLFIGQDLLQGKSLTSQLIEFSDS